MKKNQFQTKLIRWYDQNGRKDLPWQVCDSYCVWISEIMLQQTQVSSVIGYYKNFINRFPTLKILAQANIDEVLSFWSGLGYYNRARNIHKTAIICHEEHDGELPNKIDELIALPGIGPTTAGAILSLSFDLPFPILDGNVKRVMSRVFMIQATKTSELMNKLWRQVEYLMPKKNARKYNQALMDLGSLVCKRSKPDCVKCPFITVCKAYLKKQIDFYPQKNKKVKQIAQTLHVLLIKNDPFIYLQKRDSKSIWPELWFLPVFHSNKDITNTISSYPGELLETFSVTHILTHRKLTIKVTVFKWDSRSSINSIISIKGEWQDKRSLRDLPHPTALKKIIEN